MRLLLEENLLKRMLNMQMLMFKFFFFLFLVSFNSYSYWQQRVEYKIIIDFDHKNHQFLGEQNLKYFNNSKDTINKVYFHLYFNAFQPGSMMDVRSRSLPDPDRRVMDRISKLNKNEIGFHEIKKIEQDGKSLKHHTQGTVLEVELAYPLMPNESTNFYLEYFSQVPVQIRRSGRNNKEGIDYSMAQWFPKIAEYDENGWHANPYIAREFYAPWGDFDVSISINKDYIVAATGILESKKKEKDKNIWNFKAKDVHDFVWAADPDYVHDILKVDSEDLELHFYYQKTNDEMVSNWKRLQDDTADAFRYINKKFGKYPYIKYSVIQAGDGGMEYPMATLITGERAYPSLLSVTIHELIHSWYQMLLGTNESYLAWMDEGFTSFAQYITFNNLFNEKYNFINPLERSYNKYYTFIKSGLEEPLSTHSDHFSTNQAYSVGSYTKGAIFLMQLGYIIGEDKLFKGLRRYYNEWKFKHPDEYDFLRIMEKEGGIELDWYIDYWVKTTHQIDYSLELNKKDQNKISVSINRIGKMPMPIEVEVLYEDFSSENYYIPLSIMRGEKDNSDNKLIILEDWEWVNESYQFNLDMSDKEIKKIEINPSGEMADIDKSNNIIEFE
ncbi:MAG: M1 family metallopeptidase [Cytophagales bacterium]|nr:M1 family metallopeptidase [Cytophagales bacterium]